MPLIDARIKTLQKGEENMPIASHYKTEPYGYSYDPKTNSEFLFDREYKLFAAREFMTNRVDLLGACLNMREGLPFRSVRPNSEDFAGWFYDDGNSPAFDRSTRKRVKEVLGVFVSGGDVRDYLYNVPQDYQFPDRRIPKRHGGNIAC